MSKPALPAESSAWSGLDRQTSLAPPVSLLLALLLTTPHPHVGKPYAEKTPDWKNRNPAKELEEPDQQNRPFCGYFPAPYLHLTFGNEWN